MLDPMGVLLQYRYRVDPGKGQVTAVKQQEHQFRIRQFHQAVDLLCRLHAGAHVVVHGKVHALGPGVSAHLVKAPRHRLPLLFGVHRLFVQNGFVQATLNGIALLGSADHLGTQGVQLVAVLLKGGDGLLIRLGSQVRREPSVANLQPANVQIRLEHRRIGRVFVADLRAGETGQRHLADALLKGIFCAQVGHIVIGPADGGNGQFYFFRV